MTKQNPDAKGIATVVDEELKDISRRRGEDPPAPGAEKDWPKRCLEKNLFGVTISGGGIRSATFALGVLQGLAGKNLLQQADYLSTVSGGGYIGSWLQGILFHGPKSYTPLMPHVPEPAAKDPITFLRKYSNYLAPRLGLSLDTLVIPLIWFRNMALNQGIIISALVALFVLTLAPGALLQELMEDGDGIASLVSLALCVIFALIAIRKIGQNLARTVRREMEPEATKDDSTGDDDAKVRLLIAIPLYCAILLLICALAPKDGVLHPGSAVRIGVAILWVLHAALQAQGRFVSCYRARRKSTGVLSFIIPWLQIAWMSMASAGVSVFLIHLVVIQSQHWAMATGGSYFISAWAPPLYLLSVVVGVGLQIGLMGKDFPDSGREWLVRVAAQLLVIAGGWAALFAVAIFAPLGVVTLSNAGYNYIVASGGLAWVATTIMSLIAAKSQRTGPPPDQQKPKGPSALDLVARFGPIVAIAGFLIGVALVTQYVLYVYLTPNAAHDCQGFIDDYWYTLESVVSSPLVPSVLFLLASANFLILSVRVNINQFSMHQFYKNRLTRCYLGASAGLDRKPNAFTGFDPKDDFLLHKLRRDQADASALRTPYPIINATLTVTSGSELASQERKALPWFFSPRFSGFFPAHFERDTAAAGKELADSYTNTEEMMDTGVPLGTAMAISGAAGNPAMGFHSSPQTAFLLTLFNVRLGWWVGNPQNENTWKRSGPRVALWWLLRELLGFVDEKTAYLNLSDGGNFENLAMYELVRRRCRYLIVIDGEEDQDYKFQSLGGAVRKCRNDFGVEIEINPQAIRPKGDFSKSHCALGHIRYPEGEEGIILYIKAGMTGDEPADVEQYRREFPEFPQQSTVDQFFSESQFESYRRLGLHVAETVLDHISDQPPNRPRDVFNRLVAVLETAPPAPEGAATHHAEAYSRLMETIACISDIQGLDRNLVKNFPQGDMTQQQRRAYFIYLDLLQLIENVFLDLDFGNNAKWLHPGNAGWSTVIKYWAGRKEIQDVWETQKESYGRPFQTYFSDLVEEQKSQNQKT